MVKTLAAVVVVLLLLMVNGIAVAAGQEQNEGTPEIEQAGGPQFQIRPINAPKGYLEVEMAAGEQREQTVEFVNNGDETGMVRSYVTDAQTVINGGIGAALEVYASSPVLEWIDYEPEILDLSPEEVQRRTFTITVPDDVSPGEYIAMLALETTESDQQPVGTPEESAGGIMIRPVVRHVIAIAITIPGPREPGLEIGEAVYQFQPSAANVLVAVTNTGNVHLSPVAELVLRDGEGNQVTDADFELGTIYTGTSTFVSVPLLQPLDVGEYQVSLTLTENEIPDTQPITVTKEDIPLTVKAPEVAGTPEPPAGIEIESVAISETRGGDDTLQAVEIVTTIDNPGVPVSGAQLTLTVERDGELVEEYVLGSSLSFPQGSAEFRQRYVPLDGWEPGTYTFTVTLEGTDPNTKELVELSTVEAETTVTVP